MNLKIYFVIVVLFIVSFSNALTPYISAFSPTIVSSEASISIIGKVLKVSGTPSTSITNASICYGNTCFVRWDTRAKF